MQLRSFVLLSSSIVLGSVISATALAQTPSNAPSKPAAPSAKTPPTPANPQSTHYPILLFGHGTEVIPWSLLIGQKGPERFERANYPPMALDPVSVNSEGTGQAWTYHAKDSATGADVTIHLAREACTDVGNPPEPSTKTASTGKIASAEAAPAKNAFRISVEHAQVGTFNGCARIAAELFPKIVNQSEQDDDDADKKKPPVTTITNFKSPTAIAFVNPAGKIVFSRGAAKKIVPASGTDLALSHDGKKLLFTRTDSKMGSDRTIVLYDFDSGRSNDLIRGTVREAFWSPDDARIAYLQSQEQKWRVVSVLLSAPENAAPLYNGNVESLDGWVDAHTLLVGDAQLLYWVGDDRPQQTVPLKDIYGDTFRISDSDTIRVNPVNSDLLLVSAKYSAPPTGAPADAAAVFLYEIKAKRRVTLTPPEQVANHGEWSRDGIQIFYTRRLSATSSVIYRVFWDGSGVHRYQEGSDLVVGQ
jgi:hypothetical protein